MDNNQSYCYNHFLAGTTKNMIHAQNYYNFNETNHLRSLVRGK